MDQNGDIYIADPGNFRIQTEVAWDTVMAINLKAAFFMAQAVGKVMIDQGRGGRIINMTSQTGS